MKLLTLLLLISCVAKCPKNVLDHRFKYNSRVKVVGGFYKDVKGVLISPTSAGISVGSNGFNRNYCKVPALQVQLEGHTEPVTFLQSDLELL